MISGQGFDQAKFEEAFRTTFKRVLEVLTPDQTARWQELTGGSACHAASGRRFDDLAREAEAANAA